MFVLRLAVAVAGFVVASLYGIGLALVRRDRSRVPHDYARAMQRLVHPPLGLKVDVEGEENLRKRRPCVYVVNHQSAFDVPVLSGLYPEDTVLIAKKELRRIPLFGWLYAATGNILIDRSHNQRAVQRLREAELAMRDRGVSIWFFPEGTRGKVPGELLPFKKGAFYMAIAAQAPVVPIVASPVLALYDVKGRTIRPGTIRVRVLDPIPTEGMGEDDVDHLLGKVHRRMSEVLKRLRTVPAGETLPTPPACP
jgi:1-acyl-sn-glycerol-3-phosphate acyltransferase